MANRKRTTSEGKAHSFGGDWTSTKLSVLEKYLEAYTTALRNKPTAERPFRKAYIDAFAGTGYRTMRRGEEPAGGLLFPDLADAAPQELLDGSARLALKTQPRFDRYIFIERDAGRCAQLEALKEEFPDLASTIRVEQGEANQELQRICNKDWRAHRAVLFLDPYGMQVDWETIEAIARTEAIDLWLLFPLGIGVNRLLTRSGDVPPGWRMRLDRLFGTQAWYDEFYRVDLKATLFGTNEERVKRASLEDIGHHYGERLKTIFPGVAKPGVLRNSRNCPLYLLWFAAGNAKGARTALRIANYLLKEMR
jgi:three-Cys-motif partner protein